MIFYSFDSFNIWTYDSSGIKNKEGGLYFRHRHFSVVLIAQKSKKKKENNSGGKTKIDDYFGSKHKKESELCIQNNNNNNNIQLFIHGAPNPPVAITGVPVVKSIS